MDTPSTTTTLGALQVVWKRREERPGDPEGVREPRPDGPDVLSGAGAKKGPSEEEPSRRVP